MDNNLDVTMYLKHTNVKDFEIPILNKKETIITAKLLKGKQIKNLNNQIAPNEKIMIIIGYKNDEQAVIKSDYKITVIKDKKAKNKGKGKIIKKKNTKKNILKFNDPLSDSDSSILNSSSHSDEESEEKFENERRVSPMDKFNLENIFDHSEKNNIEKSENYFYFDKESSFQGGVQTREKFKKSVANLANFNTEGKRKKDWNLKIEEEKLDQKIATKKLKKSNNPKSPPKNKEKEIQLKPPFQPNIPTCSICLDTITSKARLENCCHEFCQSCIITWADSSSACPVCKCDFNKIYLIPTNSEKLKKKKPETITIKPKSYHFEGYYSDDETLHNSDDNCYVCGESNNLHQLLICDSCDIKVCHTYCIGLDKIPDEDWVCITCKNALKEIVQMFQGFGSQTFGRAGRNSRRGGR